jgi:hypothetical protein
MTRKAWRELLDDLVQIQEANARAIRLVRERIADDDSPPNVVREAEKTGPRSPFNALANLRRLKVEAKSPRDLKRIHDVALGLAEQGVLTQDEADEFRVRR